MTTGYLLLSQMRSGTTWLCSLTNSAGTMGRAKEWLSLGLAKEWGASAGDADGHFHEAKTRASTENGRFGAKIFPQQLKDVTQKFGYDFIRRCANEHQTTLILLTRRDCLRHAISIRRYFQTKRAGTDTRDHEPLSYDYAALCALMSDIEQSWAFWHSYLETNRMPHHAFVYEDLLDDPSPYLGLISTSLGVAAPQQYSTIRRIVRDDITETWVERFNHDATNFGFIPRFETVGAPARTTANFIRFLRKEEMR